ncbi:MAG: hypothetical protein ACMXX9_01645 [Candidatus Woesearchaeota archaeon]
MLDRIEDLMQSYEYVQDRVKNSSLDITIDDKNRVLIKNWHDFNNVSSKETCMGLSLKLAKDLHKENKKIDLSICEGSEPTYFFDKEKTHAFLIYTSRKKAHIIDPSLKKITELTNSNYKLKSSVNPKKNFWISDDILVSESTDLSFCFHEKYLVSLRINILEDELFSLGMTNRNKEYGCFSLDSITCSILRNENEDIDGLLNSLENSNINYSNKLSVDKYKYKIN